MTTMTYEGTHTCTDTHTYTQTYIYIYKLHDKLPMHSTTAPITARGVSALPALAGKLSLRLSFAAKSR